MCKGGPQDIPHFGPKGLKYNQLKESSTRIQNWSM